jgi:threonine dehydrogenase-like Zn-dependent dehydrogenase
MTSIDPAVPAGEARPARLAVGVVGAGRVGSVLGAALRRAGHAVVAVSAVSDASRERAELLLPGVPVLPPPDVVERSDLVLATVPTTRSPTSSRASPATGCGATGAAGRPHERRFGAAVLARRPAPERCPSRCTPR